MSNESIERFAKVLAARDAKEGGHRHGAWGVAVIAWAAKARKDHADCGALDTEGIRDFAAGEVDAPFIICTAHGRLDGPEIPK